MGLWNWLFGKEDLTPKVSFQEKERIDPTLGMIDENAVDGETKLVGDEYFRYRQSRWEFVCRIPKASEVKTPGDLPPEAPFNYCYVISGNTWCWDGSCWVNNAKIDLTVQGVRRGNGQPIKVTPPVRQVTQRRDLSSDHRISDTRPTDNGALITAVMVSQILDTDHDRPTPTPSGGSSHIGSSSNHSRHDDTPSYHSPSHDTHHTPSSTDYGSDFGGGGFD